MGSVGFRLSPQQERLLSADGRVGSVQCAARVHAPFDPPRLRAALEQVVSEHEILRTSLQWTPGIRLPTQVIHETRPPVWQWREQEGPIAEPDLAQLLAEETRQLLHGESRLRAVLCGSGHAPGVIVLTAPNALADLSSLALILDEMAARAAGSGAKAEPIQYADYAEWRHELSSGQEPEAQDARAFWTAQVREAPARPRLLFAGRPADGEHRPAAIAVALPNAGVQSPAASGAGEALFLEAVWHATLARLSASSPSLLLAWCDGRAQPDLHRAVGPYAQPVGIETRVEPETTIAELIDQLRRGRSRAERLQDYGTADDLDALSRQALAGFVSFTAPALPAPWGEIIAPQAPVVGLDLVLCAHRCGEHLQATLHYNAAAVDARDAQAVAAAYAQMLAGTLADPSTPIARLSLCDAGDRAESLAVAAGPAAGEQAMTPVHVLFERQTRAHPDAPAVADATAQLSYAQLNRAANQLARRLRELGAGPGATVAICMERTTALLQAVLGILKAGAAYLPLNHDHPPARLAHQLTDAGATVIVTEAHLRPRLPASSASVLCLDTERAELAALADADLDEVTGPGALAYVMYTSGSTGLPKGVAVTHANLSNYAVAMAERLLGDRPAAEQYFGVVSAISTDLGNTCIFPPLVGGGCVALISPAAAMDAGALVAELGSRRLDVLKITPSHLRSLLDGSHAAALLPQRWLLLGGEALAWELVERVHALAPGCRVINHYGPTETTVGCCAYDVAEQRPDAATVPIGRPLPGLRAYVLDSDLQPLPVGVPGELCIAGAGVAAGYVGATDSSERFVADPFSSARMYRTGDRVRRLRDGALEFLGRVDDQVKIRGFRVEPAEVEAALVGHPAIRQAAVLAEPSATGELRLGAYLVCAEPVAIEPLQAFLAARVPEYMVPVTFATLASLPFTPSGKIDRRALDGMAEQLNRREVEYEAPRTPLELSLATIFAELLSVPRVGIHDDFFALGGHSLLAARVVARVRSDLAVDLPLGSLFVHPTVQELTSELVGMMGDSEDQETARLVAELEALSDHEAERLLAKEVGGHMGASSEG
jgi:amino acid adenylation domain-containing protein